MTPNQIDAVLVTRGDVDLTDILASIMDAGIGRIHVWNNQERPDLSVFGRYAILPAVDAAAVYVQDDDCIIPVADVIAAYQPGRLVANMPVSRWDDYPDSTMVGWGAVFDTGLPEDAFALHARASLDLEGEQVLAEVFRRACDVVFSTLTPRTVIDVGFQHLPWAETPGRMFKQPNHKTERDAMLAWCRTIRAHYLGADDDRRVRP